MKVDARATRLLPLLYAAAVIYAAVAGWRLFYFICDDAYIEFRYVSNSMLGRGLVWNPAPFHPVEGYTSFLWVMVLRAVWTLTGVEPPNSAGVLLLCCGLGSLYLGYRFMKRMELPPMLAPWRWWLLTLVFIGTLTNRTFLTWLSSGLEAALFNLLFTWWLYEALRRKHRDSAWWALRLSTSAALSALCRPDGLLLVAATPVILLVDQWIERRLSSRRLAAAFPLLAIPAHFLWRHSFYGYWLPNTYYAKYVGPWPQSGVRYLGSFVLEYGVWLFALLAVPWLWMATRRFAHSSAREKLAAVPYIIPVAVLLAHFAYYTFIIGGDHFEFRVYSHLVLLMFLASVWLAAQWASHRWMVPTAVSAFVLVSWPIPWVHWWETRGGDIRPPIIHPIADDFPALIRPIVRQWDTWQAWLIHHKACARQEEHLYVARWLLSNNPSREQGSTISWEQHAVMMSESVGIRSWVFPNVAIIDLHGLNDAVIAHAPLPERPSEERHIAHDRHPPPGYAECFEPNMEQRNGEVVLHPRPKPLTDDQIRACESRRWY